MESTFIKEYIIQCFIVPVIVCEIICSKVTTSGWSHRDSVLYNKWQVFHLICMKRSGQFWFCHFCIDLTEIQIHTNVAKTRAITFCGVRYTSLLFHFILNLMAKRFFRFYMYPFRVFLSQSFWMYFCD